MLSAQLTKLQGFLLNLLMWDWVIKDKFCTADAPAHSHLDLGRGQTVTIVMDPLEELFLLQILEFDQD